LDDIIYSFWERKEDGTMHGDFVHRAKVECRRCGRISVVNVQTKQYTQNKKVLAAREAA
jgi:ribosomal protein L37E